MPTKAFACYSLKNEEREKSSSGGIYPLIADYVISKGGVVFSACYDSSLNVVHKRIEKKEDISASQGSKYVSSILGDTFRQIKNLVNDNRLVLFVGTPCQCEGLVAFFRVKNLPRSQILLVDFVCHGIPGRTAWRKYLDSMKNKGKELCSVNMRDKSTGWSKGNYAWEEMTVDGKRRITPRRKNAFMNGMLANLYIRPSCFECRFKGVERNTDFTLGDYWGVWTHLQEMDDDRGTSLVFVHTSKAYAIFELLKKDMKWTDAVLDKAIEANACIIASTAVNAKRKDYVERMSRGEDFISVVNSITKVSLHEKIRNKLKNKIKNRLKSV